jgi:hypothetical protein
MADTTSRPVRLVIQQRQTLPAPIYRIMAYGDATSHGHADFTSSQTLIEVLRAAIPNFDISRLDLNPLADHQSSIVFVDRLDLNAQQLLALHLN